LNPDLTASSLVAVAFAKRHAITASKMNAFFVAIVCVCLSACERERERERERMKKIWRVGIFLYRVSCDVINYEICMDFGSKKAEKCMEFGSDDTLEMKEANGNSCFRYI
jgi:hypothetical protein